MKIYVVRDGEDMGLLARRFGTEPNALARINGLGDPSRLTRGMALIIPPVEKIPLGVEKCLLSGCTAADTGLSESLRDAAYLCVCSGELLGDGALAFGDDGKVISAAAEKRVLPLLTLSNFDSQREGYSPEYAHAVLTDAAAADSFFQSLDRRLETGRYGGVCFNFQYLLPFEEDAYTALLSRAADMLHRRGLYLFAAAAPKWEGTSCSPLSAAHDYAAMGRICDRVLLLSGDGYGSYSAASCAAAQIGPGKILMELPWEGRDRIESREGDSCTQELSPACARAAAVAAGAEIRYDSATQKARFDYEDALRRRHSVEFDDVRGLTERLRIVSELGLAGVCLRCGGSADTAAQALIGKTLCCEKLL